MPTINAQAIMGESLSLTLAFIWLACVYSECRLLYSNLCWYSVAALCLLHFNIQFDGNCLTLVAGYWQEA
jgi:hypothetical protein